MGSRARPRSRACSFGHDMGAGFIHGGLAPAGRYASRDDKGVALGELGQSCNRYEMATSPALPGSLLRKRAEAVVADAPFGAAGMVEQAGGGQEEQPPAAFPEGGVGAIDVTQYVHDSGLVSIEVR